jgi:hypothetical protein
MSADSDNAELVQWVAGKMILSMAKVKRVIEQVDNHVAINSVGYFEDLAPVTVEKIIMLRDKYRAEHPDPS